jgi:hypothetical protein
MDVRVGNRPATVTRARHPRQPLTVLQ